ncbi:52 kDa repressor of the inhibitor of the protein kinase-like isoform X1 [Protopterus annectens]|uniref:52 kDa repressor of the inhibitor of the protein kinase-like isoform X1 n=1 Tax=Protopterus annectens TaxID=7888 RepID=UPI001CFBB7E3|nr:52 kDa repressor of the inhibitor of the protein kinase-like isoform X1 [Protopterus annectens]XP_043932049.1 52 kDa repressor of the inhibitor of the protein kinase-like isoform X1 [Protopterus annectens]
MPQCLAYGCKIRRDSLPPGVSFHRFPRDAQLCTRWTVNCRTDVGNIAKFVKEEVSSKKARHFLCSLHFEESQFELNYMHELLPDELRPRRPVRRLLKDAVPTLFSFSTSTPRTSSVRRLRHKQQKMMIDELLTTPQPTLEDIVREQLPVRSMQQQQHAKWHNPQAKVMQQMPEKEEVIQPARGKCDNEDHIDVAEIYAEVVLDYMGIGTVQSHNWIQKKNVACQTKFHRKRCSVGVQTKFVHAQAHPGKMIDAATQFPDLERQHW